MAGTTGGREIDGNLCLGVADRIRYVTGTLTRNLRGAFAPATIRYWYHPDSLLGEATIGPASPGRLLSEAFIRYQLPKLVVPRPVRVLDTGCGSGRMAKLLAEAGYSRGALAVRFDPDRTRVYSLGGAATFVAHLFWITLPEILMRVPLRKLAPTSYRWVLVAALGLDRWLPAAATMYAPYERARAPEGATEARA